MTTLTKFSIKHLVPVLICLGALTLIWMLFFWRILTPVPQDRVLFAQGDFTLHYYAFASYQVEQIHQGNLFPLWNPYNYGGDPFAGNVQWGTFYPPRFITAALFGADGLSLEDYQLEIAGHVWLISVMMLVFLAQLVTRWEAALFGSILYAYGGYMTGYPLLQPSVLESIAWLPLLMLGTHLSFTRQGWQIRGAVIGAIAIALSFLGGHPQTTMHMIYMTGAYALFLGWQQKLSLQGILWRGSLLVGLGVGLALVQLLPALEFTRLSSRVTQYFYEAKSNGFTPPEMIQALYPAIVSDWSPLYLGVIGFLAVIGTLLAFKRVYVFWLIVIVAGLLLALGRNSIVFDAFYALVPGFNVFRQQERVASLVVFALTVLASYQIAGLLSRQLLAQERQRQGMVIYAHAALTSAVMILGVLWMSANGGTAPADRFLNIASFVALMSLLSLGWFVWEAQHEGTRWLLGAGVIALLAVDLLTIGTRYTPNYAPNTPDFVTQAPAHADLLRVAVPDIRWQVDGGIGLQGHGTYFRITDIYGTGPFSLDSMERLRQIPVERFWEVLAVRYVTLADAVPQGVGLTLIGEAQNYDGTPYRLYELENPRPFAHLVYDYRVAQANPEFALQIMSDPRVNLREMAITTSALPFELPVMRPERSEISDFVRHSPEHLSLTVSTAENALLTLPIANYAGWRATVNGVSVALVETNGGLIGIPIMAGEAQAVVLQFAPSSVQQGAIASTLALLIGVILWVMANRLGRVGTRQG